MLHLATRSRFPNLLHARALVDPEEDAPALILVQTDQPDQIITRRHFRQQAQSYAYALHRMGIAPRDLVIIAHTHSLESVYAFWGALLLGAIPSMFPTLTEKLDPALYMASMAELVNLSQVRAVLTTDDFARQLAPRVACPVYGSAALLGEVGQGTAPRYVPDPYEVAFLQHSSGTTGLQKGVALAHERVLNQLASYADALALSAQDVIVSWLPLYHDMGLIAGFILPLVQGLPLVLMSPFDWVRHPSLLLRAIDHYQGTLCWLPNFAYNHLARRVRQADSEGLSLASMRAFINCSEPVRADSHALFVERFAAHGLRDSMLAVSYAMAENTFAVTQTPIGQAPRIDWVDRRALMEDLRALPADPDSPLALAQVSCGAPILGSEVKAVDAQGQPLPERQVGQLMIRSDCMLMAYYRRPDLQPFDAEGWYDSGDQGYIAEGQVYIIGRSKDLIINAGKNVYPQDLEALVNGVEGVHAGRAVAFGVPDEEEGTELIAVVAEVDSDDPKEHKRIKQAIRQAVARGSDVTLNYVTLVGAGWLIKTSSGKISRAKNRDKWLAEQAGRA